MSPTARPGPSRRRSRMLLAAGTALGLAVGAALALALVLRPAIAPITPPGRDAFAPDLVRRGAGLAALGDCAVCHTAPGGAALAGGRALPTPFGTLYSDNITPDPATGIGTWSEAAFARALREGVDREGRHLYPALPYEHFTHVTDADVSALYAFLMTRRPVRAPAPENELIFPLNFRPLLAGWKLMFLHEGGIAPDPARSAAWNRGAYLVQGLGHCGGCHSPRNLAGAEEGGAPFAGGSAEGWDAPPLDASNPGAARWSEAALTAYLSTGAAPGHGAAAGPMGPVTHGLSQVPPEDVAAIATYIAWSLSGGQGGATPPRAAATAPAPAARAAAAARAEPEGATLFAGACAGCHGAGAPMAGQGRPDLSQMTDLAAPGPANTLRAILGGIEPPVDGRGPKMPGFADSFTDPQVAALTRYLRARYSADAPWPDLAPAIRTAREELSR
ncbi:cytochrome c [Oceanicella sp. SM1341]|uniref:cytochrome c n=1 Tax=Oceanicella sp. SM1341 TaxID=1548889 RepID=UPI0018E531CB|nr:cytochrome c [Oceanicella sp. SM1341]